MKTSKLLLASLLAASLSGACAATGDDASLAADSAAAATRAHLDLWESDGQHYFHVVAGNGEVMLTSEGYDDRVGALGGILSVLDNGANAGRYQIATAADGGSVVRLRAANGRIIAVTESYASRSNATRAIESSVAAVAAYVERWAESTGARFEVFEGRDRRFYFTLFARNGAVVLRSQPYASEAAALNGAFVVSEVGLAAASYAVLPAQSGGYYLNLRAGNNQVVATSEVYSTKSGAARARDAIVALLPSVELL